MSHDMPENAAEVLESLLLEEPSNIKVCVKRGQAESFSDKFCLWGGEVEFVIVSHA